MNFDFPTILVLATLITGLIWLLDRALWAPRRARRAAATEDRAEAERLLKEPLIVEYSRSFFPVILIVLLLRSFLLEPFRIPSGSMMPTLLVGDFILVNKYKYGLRWPVLNRKFVEVGRPQRGDVVVFRFPRDPSTDYIKRVVGVPGDRLEYRGKTLYVNGQPMAQQPVGIYTGAGTGGRETGSRRSLEDLTGVGHSILINQQKPDFAPGCGLPRDLVVPPDSYFVMGDNRDNSNDSRCWGLVPDQNLVGKAMAIWMSWDMDRGGFPIGWERIGEAIH